MDSRHAAGRLAETAALDYLAGQGLSLVERNYRCRSGEIDLVMTHNDTLVITEVRYRRATAYGTAAQSVDPKKQSRLISAARHFLMTHPAMSELNVRFDVVAIDAGVVADDVRIQWIQDAFEA